MYLYWMWNFKKEYNEVNMKGKITLKKYIWVRESQYQIEIWKADYMKVNY